MLILNVKSIKFAVRTRAQRRSAVSTIVRQLILIREAEINCLQNTPYNFLRSNGCYIGEYAIESIDNALDLLNEAYDYRKKPMDAIPF